MNFTKKNCFAYFVEITFFYYYRHKLKQNKKPNKINFGKKLMPKVQSIPILWKLNLNFYVFMVNI